MGDEGRPGARPGEELHERGGQDPAWRCPRLEPRRLDDGRAVAIAPLEGDVTDRQPHSHLDPALRPGRQEGDVGLQRDRRLDGVGGAVENEQTAVPRHLHDRPPCSVGGAMDRGLDAAADVAVRQIPERLQHRRRTDLIRVQDGQRPR